MLHDGFLQISIGFGWISCTWIRIYIFIIYKAFHPSGRFDPEPRTSSAVRESRTLCTQEDEIKAGQEQIDSKTQELADTDEKNAQAKEDVADTKKSLSADEQFLMMLKEKCSMTDSEWEERQKTRQLEMEACSKALAVLR